MSDSRNEGNRTTLKLKESQSKVTDCLMSNYVGLGAGVLGGVYFGIRRRNLINFVLFVGIGAMADVAFGYKVTCKQLISDYEAAKKASLESGDDN